VPDILLFGATGYTGRLTAHALARRGLGFAVSGRDEHKLRTIAAATGGPEVRVAEVGDTDSLVRALEDVRVLITCVGPFIELGATAVEAALRAGVHYIDSTGEVTFVTRLIARSDAAARARGIAMATAMGFDEVPADVAVALACADMETPAAALTYAVPSTGSVGTIRSALGILASAGVGVEDGMWTQLRAGDERRWSPMPPPLGVRLSTSAPFAIGRLAPLHTEFASLKAFMTIGRARLAALKLGLPLMRAIVNSSAGRAATEVVLRRLPEGPSERARSSRWTVLAEARSSTTRRNVAVVGRDVYGLTAELLAAGAGVMAGDDYDLSGVMSPVQALGVEFLQKELSEQGVTIDVYDDTA
jgi:short subunit dehydrogenase-like uncharacterized protein